MTDSSNVTDSQRAAFITQDQVPLKSDGLNLRWIWLRLSRRQTEPELIYIKLLLWGSGGCGCSSNLPTCQTHSLVNIHRDLSSEPFSRPSAGGQIQVGFVFLSFAFHCFCLSIHCSWLSAGLDEERSSTQTLVVVRNLLPSAAKPICHQLTFLPSVCHRRGIKYMLSACISYLHVPATGSSDAYLLMICLPVMGII